MPSRMTTRRWAGLLALAAGGVVLALLATSHYGPGVYWDTVSYFAAAESVRAGAGFQDYVGSYVHWPPLYPVVLAGGSLLGLGLEATARWLSIAAYAASVLVGGRLLARVVSRSLYWWVGGVALVLGFPLLSIAVKAMTDALFVLLCLLFLGQLAAYQRRPTTRRLGLLVLIAAAGCLLRYAGVALVACGVVLVVVWGGRTVRERLTHASVFAGASLAPLLLWLGRNLAVSGTLMGRREYAENESAAVLEGFLDIIASWFVPPLGPVDGLGAVLVVLALGGAAWYGIRTGRPARMPLLRAAFLFVLLYGGMIAVVAGTESVYALNTRLLAPIYPCLVLLLCTCLARIDQVLGARQRWVRWGLRSLAFLWLLYLAGLGAAYVSLRMEQGGGRYNTAAWHTSETLAWLDAHRLDAPVRSNDPYALYHFAGLQDRGRPPTHYDRYLPADTSYYFVCFDAPQRGRLQPQDLVRSFRQLVGQDGSQDETPSPPRPDPSCLKPGALGEGEDLNVVRSFEDGAIYWVPVLASQ